MSSAWPRSLGCWVGFVRLEVTGPGRQESSRLRRAHGLSRPRRRAIAAASPRPTTPAWPGSSRRGRRRSWGVMNGPWPICRFVRPSATRASTSPLAGSGRAMPPETAAPRARPTCRPARRAGGGDHDPLGPQGPCRADNGAYPLGVKVSDRELAAVPMRDTTGTASGLHRAPYRRITVREPTLWRGDP